MHQEDVLVNVYLNDDEVPVVMRLAILRALEREWAWQGRSVTCGPHDGKPPSVRVVVTPSPRRSLSEEVQVRDRSR